MDGGDLGIARLRVRDLVSFARVMPVQKRLSRADALAVAEYVRARTRELRRR